MLKLLFALAVVVGVIVVAAQFMKTHHVNGTPPAGPQVVQIHVPNPIPGGGTPSNNDKIYVP